MTRRSTLPSKYRTLIGRQWLSVAVPDGMTMELCDLGGDVRERALRYIREGLDRDKSATAVTVIETGVIKIGDEVVSDEVVREVGNRLIEQLTRLLRRSPVASPVREREDKK